MDRFRKTSRGKYATDFSFLNGKNNFPSSEIRGRNTIYRFREKQFTGEYADNKRLIAMVDNVETELDYKVISTNYFKLLTNKMSDLVFNNEIIIKTGDIKRDRDVNDLCNRVGWFNSIREAFRLTTMYGDACIKTYAGGISAFSPLNCFKVVDIHDVKKTLAYVMYEYLLTDVAGIRTLNAIRFEIHFKGKVFEQVKEYTGSYLMGTVGRAVEYSYRGRVIPAEGVWYDTGIEDKTLVQWLSVNKDTEGVYGTSLYDDIQDLVFALEQRISAGYYGLNTLQNPFLIIGASAVVQDQKTGENKLNLVNNNMLVVRNGTDQKAEYVSPDYKLESNNQMIELFRDLIYELSELSKSYLSGQYSGNPSEESINNLIKSAIDKGNRLVTEMKPSIIESLYVLCKLNGIDINYEDISIDFTIGRTDDNKQCMEIMNVAVQNGLFSKATMREKFFGYNKEQSAEEDRQIVLEQEQYKKQNDELDNSNDKLQLDNKENNDNTNKEDETNEVE